MRLIDADKLKIRETWALVENVSNTPNGISFAPLSCVLKKDIDDAPTVDAVVNTIEVRPQGEWISKHLWDNTHIWVCSECGNRNTHGITVEKACWRCGAEMRKGGTE